MHLCLCDTEEDGVRWLQVGFGVCRGCSSRLHKLLPIQPAWQRRRRHGEETPGITRLPAYLSHLHPFSAYLVKNHFISSISNGKECLRCDLFCGECEHRTFTQSTCLLGWWFSFWRLVNVIFYVFWVVAVSGTTCVFRMCLRWNTLTRRWKRLRLSRHLAVTLRNQNPPMSQRRQWRRRQWPKVEKTWRETETKAKKNERDDCMNYRTRSVQDPASTGSSDYWSNSATAQCPRW